MRNLLQKLATKPLTPEKPEENRKNLLRFGSTFTRRNTNLLYFFFGSDHGQLEPLQLLPEKAKKREIQGPARATQQDNRKRKAGTMEVQ